MHTLSFGAHEDQYTLFNPTYNTADWLNGGSNYTGVATEGDGKTRTQALWIQDKWRITPVLDFTFGGRYENWRADEGYNVNGATKVNQPTETASRFSPKGVLAWAASPEWTVTASLAQAWRFATASESTNASPTGTTFTSPNPDLKPDNDVSAELRVQRKFERGAVQVALFQDDVHDAIIGQFLPLVPNSPTLYSYNANVDHVRARGVELVLGSSDLFVSGLEFSGSVTYVDARTLAISGQASATAPAGSAIGKFLPNIPDWRATFLATYHVNDHLALTLGGRYSGQIYTTLDNSDVDPNVYQGFSDWFVADVHGNYRLDDHWTVNAGVDNVLDRKYFFFHPFPQRTFVMSLKYGF